MKKHIVLLLFLLGNLTISYSNNLSDGQKSNTLTNKKTAFDDLVGTYKGFTLTEEGLDNANQIVVELTADFKLKITENFDGLFVEHINERLFPEAAGFLKAGNYAFNFIPVNKPSEFELIRVLFHKEPVIPNSDYKVSFLMKGKEQSIFTVIKEGGNPNMPGKDIKFQDIYKADLYTGRTKDDTFGDFKIEWYSAREIGYLKYKNLTNIFKITMTKNNRYRVVHNNNSDAIELEYAYPYNSKMKLMKIHHGKSLFDKEKVKPYENGKSVSNKKEFFEIVGESFYKMIHDQFKVRGEYNLTYDNKSNGSGIKIVVIDNDAVVYSGELKNAQPHGKGAYSTLTGGERGSFQEGSRQGHFYTYNLDGYKASGEYVNNQTEGLWKVKFANNSTVEIIFKNGKEVSRKNTNKGVKNTQIAKHVDDAEYQLKSVNRLYSEISGISSRCSDRTTLRSYQSCFRPMKPKIDAFSVGIVAAIRELEKAKKEAEKSSCAQTLQVLKNAESDLWKANGELGDAYKAVTELYHATTVSNARAEYGKCITALNKSIEAMNDYNIWVASLALEKCYTYTTTDNSTLPSRTSSKSISSNKSSSPSYSKNKTTSTNKTNSQRARVASSSTVVYPAFSGKYEGDNLLLLMGRKVDDPAIQNFLKDKEFGFTESTYMVPQGERNFSSSAQHLSIRFKKGILYKLEFSVDYFEKSKYFKNKMPLDIPLGKSLNKMKNMKGDWKLVKYSSNHTFNLYTHQLAFKAKGTTEAGIVEMVEVLALDVKDWNSYYRQFK